MGHMSTHQKLKKSLTSFSVVSWLMPLTLTVLDMVAVCLEVMDWLFGADRRVSYQLEELGEADRVWILLEEGWQGRQRVLSECVVSASCSQLPLQSALAQSVSQRHSMWLHVFVTCGAALPISVPF
jgi:hypothetical protein